MHFVSAPLFTSPATGHGCGIGELSSGEQAVSAAVAVLIALALGAYIVGARKLHRRAVARGLGTMHLWAFAAGIGSLLAALYSPLDSLAERSFALHMVQHESLMLISAPLLVLGRPLAIWAWAFPGLAKRIAEGFSVRPVAALWRFVTTPAGATLLQLASLWLWHLPAAFDAALASPLTHFAQHATFLFAATCFWWSIVHCPRARRGGAGIVALFVSMVGSGALGALLGLSPSPWYEPSAVAVPWGLTALEDQQLGGMIMWIPGGAAYVAAALWCTSRLLISRPTAIFAAGSHSGQP